MSTTASRDSRTSTLSWLALAVSLAAVVALQVVALTPGPEGAQGAVRWFVVSTPICAAALAASLGSLLAARARRTPTTVPWIATGLSLALLLLVGVADVVEAYAAMWHDFR